FLDNLYEPYHLVVELDGLAFHPPEERDTDKYRDNETVIATDAVTLRYGFRQVANRPCDQAAQFARALIKNGCAAATLKACPKPNCPVRPRRLEGDAYHHWLELKGDGEGRADAGDDAAGQGQQVGGGGVARVDQGQRVLGGNVRRAGRPVALGEARSLDE